MKHSLFMFFIFFQLSISAQYQPVENFDKIFGEWTYQYREHRSWTNNQIEVEKMSFDEVVKVSFNSNNFIVLKHQNNQEEKFTWKLKRNKVKIKHIGNGESGKFLKGEFIIFLSKDQKTLELRYAGPPHDRIFLSKT